MSDVKKQLCSYFLPEIEKIIGSYLSKSDKLFISGKMSKINISRYASGNNDFELLQWARKNGCPWDKHTCSEAATGRLEVIEWLDSNFTYF